MLCDTVQLHQSNLLCVNGLYSTFYLCGKNITWENEILSNWIKKSDVQHNYHLIGLRNDIPRLTAALNIATSSSYGEAWPVIIGEAMACGIPCVATKVGDSELIISNTYYFSWRRKDMYLKKCKKGDFGIEIRNLWDEWLDSPVHCPRNERMSMFPSVTGRHGPGTRPDRPDPRIRR